MIRAGIIGAGHFAGYHLRALGQLPERVRVTCYARRERGKPFPEALAIGAEERSLDGVLGASDVDAVMICATNDLHAGIAQRALRAGKHVFCEKPLALTVADADAAMSAARDSGRVLMVGHLTRHVPAYRKVAEVLASGRLGAARMVYLHRMHCSSGRSWRMDPRVGGGVVFDLLIHDLDLLNWYLGVPRRVVARGHLHEQGGHDYVAALFSYGDDRTAVLEGGFVFRPPAGLRAGLRVICERGHIEVNTNDLEFPVRIFEENKPEEPMPVKMDRLREDGLRGEFEEFLDTIDGRPHDRLRLEDARQAVACAAAVIQAAETGEEVAVQ